ncbi:Cof-type HAD-IIB family hydrolase [Wenyingzhuangia sp. chi5]|uniref:Cof-type HAD-IIB family hydrolase n=1 Tax=Wenyingzhuangia gilva TaxID=3057677 RepID=A0ABT8VQV7_9FLAO|nr:Cof-type HAD-IIB family hydrolase [Wenyingzhuangia sp. chi5]MDO3694351.1 Cof-type HAD-IIB family hydrolase [Wenyingzhuangia sp. chi5]
MDLSKVKLIVTDMDGTLLNSEHNVSNLFFEQFEILKAKNIKFVAASGRQYHSILDKLKSIKEHITIVAENGAYVVENETELYVNAIHKKDIKILIKIAQQIPDTHIILCGKKKAYFLKDSGEFKNIVIEYYSEYELIDSFEELPEDDFFKITLCNFESSEKNIYPYLKDIDGDWQIKVSAKQWVDVALPSNHKGNALTRIQEQYGISDEETMVFGDYQNDIEMLKKAKFSFAMENAHKDVQEVANYKTLSNDNLGVETIIGKLIDRF